MTWWSVRERRDADEHYIRSSWVRAHEHAHWTFRARHDEYLVARNRPLGGALRDAYFEEHAAVVDALLARSCVLVAHVAGEPDAIAGWAAASREAWAGVVAVHWVHVRAGRRRHGVGRALYEGVVALAKEGDEVDVVHTHRSHVLRFLPAHYQAPMVPYPAFFSRASRGIVKERTNERSASVEVVADGGDSAAAAGPW